MDLREVEQGDLPLLFEFHNDPESYRMSGLPPKERHDFMDHWAGILANDRILKRMVLIDSQPVGYAVCFDQDGLSFLGYWVRRESWGRGIGTQAVARFLELVDRRPLFAIVSSGNAGSIRILEKTGFLAVHPLPEWFRAREGESGALLFALH